MTRASDLQVAPAQEAGPPGSSMGRTAARGIAWTGLAQLIQQVVQFGAGIVVARLLAPADFGLVAVTWAVTSLAFPLTELGLAASLVQQPVVRDKDKDSAFWLSLLTGLGVAGAVAALAPVLARAYGQPRLTGLLLLSTVNFVLATNVVQTAMLERRLQFRVLALLELTAQLVGWTVAITCAAAGMGAWSLLLGPQSALLVQTVVIWTVVRWRPRSLGDRAGYRQLWRYGRGVIVYRLTEYAASNVDSMTIPVVATATDLGLYNRSFNLTRLPVQQVVLVLGRVFFPVLSAIKGDRDRLRSATEKVFVTSAAIGLPAALGLLVGAPVLVPVLYGRQWEPMIPYLQVLAVAIIPTLLSASVGYLFQVLDRTHDLARYGLLQSALTVVAVVAGLPWGVRGVSVALAVRAWLGAPLLLGPPLALIGIRLRRAVALVAGVGAAGAVLVAAGAAAQVLTAGLPDVERLAVTAAAGAGAYLAALRVFSPRAWGQFREIARRQA